MNRMKWVLALACVVVCQVKSFAVEKKCIVSGKINGAEKNTKVTVSRKSGEYGTATVIITKTNENGEISFTIPATSEMMELRLENTHYSMNFFSENGHIVINADKNKLYGAVLKGAPENERWSNYQQFSTGLATKRNALMMDKSLSKEERGRIFHELDAEQKHFNDSVILNSPKSVVALYLAKVPLPLLKYYQIDSVLAHFKPYFANHQYFLEMKKRADVLRKVATGAIAPDFTVLTPDGKTKISLSSFRGKYVMLDFWASWCVPCREENKHTKELYNKYHPSGLEIVSFSLDSDIEAWRKAVEKDGLTWNNASDLVGGKKSPVATKYGIDGLPAVWIIDPTGKIVAESLRGEALDQFLDSIL